MVKMTLDMYFYKKKKLENEKLLLFNKVALMIMIQLSPRGLGLWPLRLQGQTLTTELKPHGEFQRRALYIQET
jgi:hypothetical protein